MSPPIELPMLGPDPSASRPDDVRLGADAGPDPELIAAGWEHRFVAAGPRLEEMQALYGELGFEVLARPIRREGLDAGCVTCFSGGMEYSALYTRRPSGASENPEPIEPMTESHPTRVLREEHQLILEVADKLRELSLADTSKLDFDTFEKCVKFIRLFADACHHGKEEDLLFTTLEEHGMPRDSGPIAVMLYEHSLGREHVAAMSAALPDAREGDEGAARRLVNAGRSYVELIRNHILKEDNVLFNMADQMVGGMARSALCAAYDETCHHSFEGCTKVQLEELGKEILSA